jgi:hypothetical protein
LHLRKVPGFTGRSSQKKLFQKTAILAAFMKAPPFEQGSGETRRRGRLQRPMHQGEELLRGLISSRTLVIACASVGVTHIDLIEHVIECLRIVHLDIQTA